MALRHMVGNQQLFLLPAEGLDRRAKIYRLAWLCRGFFGHSGNQRGRLARTLHLDVNVNRSHVGFLLRILTEKRHDLRQLAHGSLSDVRGCIVHVRALDFAILARRRANRELEVRRRLADRIRCLAHRCVSDARHENRQKILVVGDLRRKLPVIAERRVLHAHAHRHALGKCADDAGDARLSILIDAPDDVADARNLHAVRRTADRADDPGIRHEVVDISLVQERMTKGEHALSVDCRHRPRRADGKIAVGNGDADGAPGRESRIIDDMCTWRRRAEGWHLARLEPEGGELLLHIGGAASAEPCEIERRLRLRLVLLRRWLRAFFSDGLLLRRFL